MNTMKVNQTITERFYHLCVVDTDFDEVQKRTLDEHEKAPLYCPIEILVTKRDSYVSFELHVEKSIGFNFKHDELCFIYNSYMIKLMFNDSLFKKASLFSLDLDNDLTNKLTFNVPIDLQSTLLNDYYIEEF